MNISFRNAQPVRDETLLSKWLLHFIKTNGLSSSEFKHVLM